jgi:hypothetical protein
MRTVMIGAVPGMGRAEGNRAEGNRDQFHDMA